MYCPMAMSRSRVQYLRRRDVRREEGMTSTGAGARHTAVAARTASCGASLSTSLTEVPLEEFAVRFDTFFPRVMLEHVADRALTIPVGSRRRRHRLGHLRHVVAVDHEPQPRFDDDVVVREPRLADDRQARTKIVVDLR